LHSITYVNGDATLPEVESQPGILAHVCNDAGLWGRGFVLALSRRWNGPEEVYRSYPRPLEMGSVQFVPVSRSLVVANMVAQTHPTDAHPLSYHGLRVALSRVFSKAAETKSNVHMPLIGADLAGGDWRKVAEVITEELVQKGIQVYVYDGIYVDELELPISREKMLRKYGIGATLLFRWGYVPHRGIGKHMHGRAWPIFQYRLLRPPRPDEPKKLPRNKSDHLYHAVPPPRSVIFNKCPDGRKAKTWRAFQCACCGLKMKTEYLHHEHKCRDSLFTPHCYWPEDEEEEKHFTFQ